MDDRRFDEAQARAWSIEVDGVLEEVDKLLEQVATECATQPYEDDTIMNTLHSLGSGLGDAWKVLCGQFRRTTDEFKRIIQSMGNAVANAQETIVGGFKGKTY